MARIRAAFSFSPWTRPPDCRNPARATASTCMGGNHARIEGAYVLYNAQTGFYYMFTSFGGLAANGGYNIRVARSQAPDGPYFDAAGTNMETVRGNPAVMFDDTRIAPHGQKLMGNFQFALATGETGTAEGYVSPGHNSAYLRRRPRQVLPHFPHALSRLAASSTRSACTSCCSIPRAGRWSRRSATRRSRLSPTAGGGRGHQRRRPGRVQARRSRQGHQRHHQDVAGHPSQCRWHDERRRHGHVDSSRQQSHRRHLDLTAASLYNGVLSRQWNTNANRFVVTFSAQASHGVSVWGARTGD